MNTRIMKAMGFAKEVEAFENGLCAFCRSEKTKREDFKDEISWRDYQITGLCQACQDKTYNAAKSL